MHYGRQRIVFHFCVSIFFVYFAFIRSASLASRFFLHTLPCTPFPDAHSHSEYRAPKHQLCLIYFFRHFSSVRERARTTIRTRKQTQQNWYESKRRKSEKHNAKYVCVCDIRCVCSAMATMSTEPKWMHFIHKEESVFERVECASRCMHRCSRNAAHPPPPACLSASMQFLSFDIFASVFV